MDAPPGAVVEEQFQLFGRRVLGDGALDQVHLALGDRDHVIVLFGCGNHGGRVTHAVFSSFWCGAPGLVPSAPVIARSASRNCASRISMRSLKYWMHVSMPCRSSTPQTEHGAVSIASSKIARTSSRIRLIAAGPLAIAARLGSRQP